MLLACSGFSAGAQHPYFTERPEFLKGNSVWVFGNKAGIDFNSGTPTGIVTAISGTEGFGSVSDPVTGQMLFYSNGKTCWNANNQPMSNGTGLLGNGDGTVGTPQTPQGVCIVPVIDSPGKYYLFSLKGLTGAPTSYTNGTLFYSVVDMGLNGGLGDIVAGRKNIVLNSDTLSEAMIAIPGDQCDIWLMVHAYNKPEFKAYHITAAGIDPAPVVTNIPHSSIRGAGAYCISYMAISPDRRQIALSSAIIDNTFPLSANGVLLGKFDAATGQVDSLINILDIANYTEIYPSGVCFSPDNSKLYLIAIPAPSWMSGLYQFEVGTRDSATIVASTLRITDVEESYDLRRREDKIYIDGGWGVRKVRCINQPNLSGTACAFQDMAFNLATGTAHRLGIGNDVVYPVTPDTLFRFVADTAICPGGSLTLQPASAGTSAHFWDDGSTGQSRTINGAGVYWVAYKENGCQPRVDTFVVNEIQIDPQITVNGYVLGTTQSYSSYQWLRGGIVIPGATNSTYTVPANDGYSVIVTTPEGCTDTSDTYTVTNVGIAGTIALAGQVHIYPNPAKDVLYISSPVPVHAMLSTVEGRTIMHVRQETFVPVKGLPAGIYLLQLTDREGRFIKMEKIIKE